MAIRFFFEETGSVKGLKKNKTKEIIRRILADFSFTPGSINIILTTDNYLLGLNRKFLQHDYYTDVVTFPVYESEVVSGDIFISIDRIRENAETFGVSPDNELLRVIIHGALHLCGMEDTTPALKKSMAKQEDRYLGLF